MAKEIIVKLYSFNELSEKAQQKAINKEVEFLQENFHAESLTSLFKEDLKSHYGINVEDVYWSLSYCQGDGVSFVGTFQEELFKKVASRLDSKDLRCLERVLKVEESFINMFKIIKNDHRYQHEYTMTVQCHEYWNLPNGGHIERMIENLTNLLTSEIRSIGKEMQENGYKEIEHRTSEDYAKEEIEQSDNYYYDNGVLYY
jgi:hypothetical protein